MSLLMSLLLPPGVCLPIGNKLHSSSLPLALRHSVFNKNNNKNKMSMSQLPIRCCHESERVVGPNAVRERYIQHFLLKEEETSLLDRLQRQLEDGVAFADIVLQYSYVCPNPTGSENIGEGLVDKYQLLQCPEFAEAAFGTPCRNVARCKTRFGWHLIQVLGQRDTDAPVKLIKPAELHQKMQDPLFSVEAQLIDIREPDQVSKASLPGFKVFPLARIGTWSRDITTKLDCSKDTYVLCYDGSSSEKIANWMQLQGFESIYTVVGGINAYAKDVNPSLPIYKETRVCLIPYAIEKISRKISERN